MEKIDALKYTNSLLSNKMKSIFDSLYPFNEKDNYLIDVLFQTNNEETSTNFFKIKAGMKSKILSEKEFKRIICIKGMIKIHYIIPYDEERTLTSPNTQLIMPETSYIIECIEDAELITVYKPKKEGQRYVISEQKTIYNKV